MNVGGQQRKKKNYSLTNEENNYSDYEAYLAAQDYAELARENDEEDYYYSRENKNLNDSNNHTPYFEKADIFNF